MFRFSMREFCDSSNDEGIAVGRDCDLSKSMPLRLINTSNTSLIRLMASLESGPRLCELACDVLLIAFEAVPNVWTIRSSHLFIDGLSAFGNASGNADLNFSGLVESLVIFPGGCGCIVDAGRVS